ncbi:hypothetical protein [Methylomagnum ishizawai]|uniref:hypothetical protein n=1 Tax=Methylomagnum ishizawai TaxID=1760988 RepID=UPI000F735438|nr:hypothetical protein [Methylomagnum ishizawai]
MILRKTLFLSTLIILNGCTGNLERRLSIVESSLYRIEQGLLDNDRNMKNEIRMLKQETEAELNRQRRVSNDISGSVDEVKRKTDKFCVHTPDENNLQIFPEGQCP